MDDPKKSRWFLSAVFTGGRFRRETGRFSVFSPDPRRGCFGGKDFWKIGLIEAAFCLCLLAPERRVCGRSMRLRKDS